MLGLHLEVPPALDRTVFGGEGSLRLRQMEIREAGTGIK